MPVARMLSKEDLESKTSLEREAIQLKAEIGRNNNKIRDLELELKIQDLI